MKVVLLSGLACLMHDRLLFKLQLSRTSVVSFCIIKPFNCRSNSTHCLIWSYLIWFVYRLKQGLDHHETLSNKAVNPENMVKETSQDVFMSTARIAMIGKEFIVSVKVFSSVNFSYNQQRQCSNYLINKVSWNPHR